MLGAQRPLSATRVVTLRRKTLRVKPPRSKTTDRSRNEPRQPRENLKEVVSKVLAQGSPGGSGQAVSFDVVLAPQNSYMSFHNGLPQHHGQRKKIVLQPPGGCNDQLCF